MLEESTALLAQIKNQSRVNEIKKAKRKYYFGVFKKWSIRISIAILIISIAFFPVHTATVLGHWFNNFFGTLIKTIN